MIPFSNFSHLRKKFISLQLDKPSIEAMRFWCASNNFDLTKDFDGSPADVFDFHLTVFYTDNEVDLNNVELTIPRVLIQFNDLKLFGLNNNIPVLTVNKTVTLLGIRNMFESKGLTDKFPDWQPHVSVSYNYNGTSEDLFNIKLPTFQVFSNKIIIKDQS